MTQNQTGTVLVCNFCPAEMMALGLMAFLVFLLGWVLKQYLAGYGFDLVPGYLQGAGAALMKNEDKIEMENVGGEQGSLLQILGGVKKEILG